MVESFELGSERVEGETHSGDDDMLEGATTGNDELCEGVQAYLNKRNKGWGTLGLK